MSKEEEQSKVPEEEQQLGYYLRPDNIDPPDKVSHIACSSVGFQSSYVSTWTEGPFSHPSLIALGQRDRLHPSDLQPSHHVCRCPHQPRPRRVLP